MLVVDNFSYFIWYIFVSIKCQAKIATGFFKTMDETKFSTSIKFVQRDGKGEF